MQSIIIWSFFLNRIFFPVQSAFGCTVRYILGPVQNRKKRVGPKVSPRVLIWHFLSPLCRTGGTQLYPHCFLFMFFLFDQNKDVLKAAREAGNPIQALRTIVLRDVYAFIAQNPYNVCSLASYYHFSPFSFHLFPSCRIFFETK